jgi:hypothetical protein
MACWPLFRFAAILPGFLQAFALDGICPFALTVFIMTSLTATLSFSVKRLWKARVTAFLFDERQLWQRRLTKNFLRAAAGRVFIFMALSLSTVFFEGVFVVASWAVGRFQESADTSSPRNWCLPWLPCPGGTSFSSQSSLIVSFRRLVLALLLYSTATLVWWGVNFGVLVLRKDSLSGLIGASYRYRIGSCVG